MLKFRVLFLFVLLCTVIGAVALVVLYGLSASQPVENTEAQTIAVAMKADGCVAFLDHFNSTPQFDYYYNMPVGPVDTDDYITDGNLKLMSPGGVIGPRVGKNFTLTSEVNGIFENPFTQATFGVNSNIYAGEKEPEWNAHIAIGYFEGSEPVISFIVREGGKEAYKSQSVQIGSIRDELRIGIVKDGVNVSAYYLQDKKEVLIGKFKLKTDKSAGLYTHMTSTAFSSVSMTNEVRAGITGGASFDFLKLNCARI